MKRIEIYLRWAALAAAMFFAASVNANDLGIGPTRLIFVDGGPDQEIYVINQSDREMAYRINVEPRRMAANGRLVRADDLTEGETAARDAIIVAPRRITLAPGASRVVRVGVLPLSSQPDGEYRTHLVFRRLPDPDRARRTDDNVTVQAIYGISIPVIIRRGEIESRLSFENAVFERSGQGASVIVDLVRSGEGSVFGSVIVMAAGWSEPLVQYRGLAVYPEIERRRVRLPLPADLPETIEIRFREGLDANGAILARTSLSTR